MFEALRRSFDEWSLRRARAADERRGIRRVRVLAEVGAAGCGADPAERDAAFGIHAAYLVAVAAEIWPRMDVGIGMGLDAAGRSTGRYSFDVAGETVAEGTWLEIYAAVHAKARWRARPREVPCPAS